MYANCMDAHVSQLFIYPVKSLAGISLRNSMVEARGLQHDRRWMIVDQESRFISQREVPGMATICTALSEQGTLTLSKAGESMIVPAYDSVQHPLSDVQVWDSVVPAAHLSAEVDAWLSSHLGRPAFLVYMPDQTQRPIDPDYATGDEIVSFADGFPILLANIASLKDLNARMGDGVPMDRFRPNIVVSCDQPFLEDGLGSFRLGTSLLEGVKPCARCSITTVDQSTGERTGKEPLKTLATFRRKGSNVLFGENLVVRSTGVISIGDQIEPLAPRQIFPRSTATG